MKPKFKNGSTVYMCIDDCDESLRNDLISCFSSLHCVINGKNYIKTQVLKSKYSQAWSSYIYTTALPLPIGILERNLCEFSKLATFLNEKGDLNEKEK